MTIDSNNFDSGWGIWNDGGSDCRRSANDAAYANSGSYCVRLQDNTSTSVMTTDNLNLVGFEEVTIAFSYVAVGMDNSNEGFWLQVSTNGGASYYTVSDWYRDTDFANNNRYNESVTLVGTFVSNTRFRLRCNASANADRVYIDDVTLTGCVNGARNDGSISVIDSEPSVEDTFLNPMDNLSVYPNPTSDVLNVKFNVNTDMDIQVMITDMQGRTIENRQLNAFNGAQQIEINTSQLEVGTYMITLLSESGRLTKRFVVFR